MMAIHRTKEITAHNFARRLRSHAFTPVSMISIILMRNDPLP